MLANQRRERIIDMIKEDGYKKVAELSRLFKVSEVTIRQDLVKLERDGFLVREHGGAYLKNMGHQVRSFSLLNQENMEQKQSIAACAAEFIHDGDTIILDSGSTVTRLAQCITSRQNLTVITNAMNIGLMLGAEPAINVNLTGGEFKAPTLSLTGQKAAEFFSGLHVGKLFLATAGITLKSGLTYPSLSDLCVKKAMIEAAEITYLLADSTKIGKAAFASLGALSLINYLITDSGISAHDREMFKKHDIDFIIAE